MGTPGVGTVTPGLCAQWRGNVHQPNLGHSESCGSSIPPHGKAAIAPPVPSQHPRHPHMVPPSPHPGADARGLSPTKGRSGMLPLGVHSHLAVDQHGLQGLGLVWMEQDWGWAQPRHDPQGWSGHTHLTRSRSLVLAPWAHFPGSTF